MRYLLDTEGYIAVASNNRIECEDQYCIGYKGTIPEGYSSVEEWATNANIRAYYIDDNGNLALDEARLETLENCLTHKAHCYSSEEKIIGTWFDKPLYQRTIYYASADSQKFVPNHNIDNFEGIVNAYGRFTRVSTGIQCLIPMNYTSWESFIYDFTATNYVLRWSDAQWNAGVSDIYVTLEYTKTTDLPKIEFVGNNEPEADDEENNDPEEPTTPTFTIADNWAPYNSCTIDGTTIKDNLNAWISASNDDDFKGLSLDFTLTETHNLKATFDFEGYEGCPRYQVVYIIKDGSEWLHEFAMTFDKAGTNFVRTINQVLEAGSYQLVLGSWGNMDFGVKCNEISLTTEMPQNLFDLSSYSFPTTKYGLTFNYDDVKKSLKINGESNDDFGLYIPCVLKPGNYTFSYQANQTELGFYFSIDEISASQLTGWGKNNKTFDVTSTTSQIILWFDAGYTYNNLELSFNLVKND